ncbi:uncharacterized protein UTRI_05233 [Ustilago trichophora]|uniref:Uncharacterized protein n=1 Tax=Ustilago trichophora TaxID=86804 RepID=A0A5C3ELT9_9BASI|nr:uncharacterized protein UTRI_05233 [Ustilago trichophora]
MTVDFVTLLGGVASATSLLRACLAYVGETRLVDAVSVRPSGAALRPHFADFLQPIPLRTAELQTGPVAEDERDIYKIKRFVLAMSCLSLSMLGCADASIPSGSPSADWLK